MAAVKVGERWGFIDTTGRLAVPAEYDDADSFSEGMAAVSRGGSWSYIDPRGAVRLAGPFESARAFHCGVARVKKARAFHLGQRAHGFYELREDSFQLREAARNEVFGAVVHPNPQAETSPDGLDDIALAQVYADADHFFDFAMVHSWSRAPRRLLEPQWDEHVWVNVDVRGRVVPAERLPRCAGSAPSSPVPVHADLRARLLDLDRMRDRMAFFRDVQAVGAAAVPGVVEVLADPRKPVRLNALETLVRLGEMASAAVPALVAALDDPDGDVHLFTVWALGRIGPDASPAIPALMRGHARHARLVEAALTAIAPTDPAVVALLERSAQHARSRGRIGHVRTLVERHDPGATAAIVALFSQPERDEALALLGTMGEAGRAAVPDVETLLRTLGEAPQDEALPDAPRYRKRCAGYAAAASALWRISHDASRVLPSLQGQLERPSAEGFGERCDPWALRVYMEMGRDAASAAPALRRYARENTDAAPAVEATLRALEAP
jgi:hypothetical protein